MVVCREGKEVTLKLSRNPMAAGGKLNFVSLDQLDDDWFVVVIRARQEEGVEPKAKSRKVLPKSIKEVLKRYKDVLAKGLSQELPPKREVDHKIKIIPEADPPSKASYRLNQVESMELKKQLNDLLARDYIWPSKGEK
jgi:hypothetical protein